MSKDNIAIAEAYYTAMGEKNFAVMEGYLHPDVQFTSPFAMLTGKQPFLEAAKKLTTVIKSLTIRATCGSEDNAMVAYDLDFPEPIGKVPTAALLTFKDGLIAKIEIFFDARAFGK